MSIQAQFYSNNLGFPLCGSQDLMIENGHGSVGLAQSCFNLQQKHHQLQQQQEQSFRQSYNERQRNPNMFVDTNLLFGSTSKANNLIPSSMPIPQTLALQFEKQSQDIDRYIRLQNEKLRVMLQEQRKQHMATMIKKVETDAIYLLRQKDEEIAQAAKKRMELEEFLRRLEEENQAWRRLAQEREAVVLSLHNTLEQMKERACHGFNNGVAATDDAGSCCNEESEKKNIQEEEREERRIGIGGAEDVEVEQSTRKMMVCKSCDSGKACFLFLPCRHLCSCKACEALLQACPVCSMPKKASIETLIF